MRPADIIIDIIIAAFSSAFSFILAVLIVGAVVAVLGLPPEPPAMHDDDWPRIQERLRETK